MVEKDFYTVNEHNGTKFVCIEGWTEDRMDHMVLCYPPSDACFEAGTMPKDITFPELERYEYDWDESGINELNGFFDGMTLEEVVKTFYDGKPGVHLALRDVSESTPCGEYWCYVDEEVAE